MAASSKSHCLRFLSLNCHGVNDCIIRYLRRISVDYDVILLQETWLSDLSCSRLADISGDFVFFHSSAIEEKLYSGFLSGRPFGGTAILVRQSLASRVTIIPCNNPRITAVCCTNPNQQDMVICSIYMPYNDRSTDQLAEYESTIGSLQAVMDSHFGCLFVLGGDFNVTRHGHSAAGQALDNFCNGNALLWLEPVSNDIDYTFHNDANSHYSLIDHFLCSPNMSNGSKATHILADGDNTSDHLATCVSLNIPYDIEFVEGKPLRPSRLRWDRADTLWYQDVVASHLSNITIPIDALLCTDTEVCIDHLGALDKYYSDILHCLSLSSKLCIPEVKVGIEKHWWSPDLDDLKQQCIDATTLWRMAGCPRTGDINANRVKIKLRYKKAVKDAAHEAEAQLNDELFYNLCNKDNVSFWKAWRKRFCMNNLKSASVVNGASGDKNILKEFSEHFSQVGQPNSADADRKYDTSVRQFLISHSSLSGGEDVKVVSTDLLHECIGNLKLRKAAGHDGIYNEHIIFAGPQLEVHLSLLFTAMLRHSHVPNDFCFGIVKPLLKCKNGDQSNLNMYRGITLTPVISKLFESVLLGLYSEYLITDPLQYGFKKNSSCNHALFTFVESVKYFTKSGSKVHCAFLDASKAFDKVLINGLLSKLIERKLPFHFISILHNWYSNLSCSVVWNMLTGTPFSVGCGVRQGSPLSPFLFAIYVDDLIGQLRNSDYGICIGNTFAGCLFYADDIVLLSSTWYGLQKLSNICYSYGKTWDIRFNPLKSQVITFGGRPPQSAMITMGDSTVPLVNRVKYLGCYFTSPSAEADLSVPLGKFYGSFNNIMNVLGYNRNEPLAVHLAKTYCLPTILYGCETWFVSAGTLKSMSVAWNNVFRKVFNTCWRESPRSLQLYCNCLPIAFLVDQRRLLFWKKVMFSDHALLRILAKRGQAQISAIAAKYGITQLMSCPFNLVKRQVFSAFASTVL